MTNSDTLTVQDRTDLMKLAKALAIKSTQIIIQSRDGSKVHTKCSPNSSGHATFNLAFREMWDVDKEAKRTMSTVHGDRWSLCVEIFLRTVDGDIMILESWNISLIPTYGDTSKLCTLYGRLGILLKSVIAISRVVPAYRYSRRQNPDTWTIGHRMYLGEPSYNSLGDEYKQLKVGNVSTPIGVLQVSVAYRTNMTMSPQPSGLDTSMKLENDHFKPVYSPSFGKRDQCSDENSTSLSEESIFRGAFVIPRRESLNKSDSDQLIPTMPFGNLLSISRISSQKLTPTNTMDENEKQDKVKAVEVIKNDANANVTKSVSSCNDDFIVINPVKPAFAAPSGNIELGTFYKEWKSAPPLQTCCDDPKVIDQIGDLTSQLAFYETSSKEFDTVITSLCDEKNNNEKTPFVES